MSTYKNPKITINKVYTKAGDKGQTFLIGDELWLNNKAPWKV